MVLIIFLHEVVFLSGHFLRMHLPGKVGFVKSLRVQANSFYATCQNKVVDLLCLVKAQLRVVSSCQWPHLSLALIASMNLQSVVQRLWTRCLTLCYFYVWSWIPDPVGRFISHISFDDSSGCMSLDDRGSFCTTRHVKQCWNSARLPSLRFKHLTCSGHL